MRTHIAGMAVSQGLTVRVTDAQNDDRFRNSGLVPPTAHSMLCAPIYWHRGPDAGTRVIGCIQVVNAIAAVAGFSPLDAESLEVLSTPTPSHCKAL